MMNFTSWNADLYSNSGSTWGGSLCHHQIKGAKHGVRRFQNEDGSLTPAGRERYGVGEARKPGGLKNLFGNKEKKKRVSQMTDEELKKAIERRNLEKEYRDANPYKGVLEKGIDLAKGAIESHNARKEAEAERKVKNREISIREKEANANLKRANADETRANADYNRAKAEYLKWDHYTSTTHGKRQLARELKAKKLAAKSDLIKAKTEKKKSGFISQAIADHFSKNVAERKLSQIKAETRKEETIGLSRENAAYYSSEEARNKAISTIASKIDPKNYSTFIDALTKGKK